MNLPADEEMRMVYGTNSDHDCRNCESRDGSYCVLTNRRRKCSDYGSACGKFKDNGKYRFTL